MSLTSVAVVLGGRERSLRRRARTPDGPRSRWKAPFVGRLQWRRNVTWSSVTLSIPWPAPPFALACPDSKAKCAARSEPSAADRCNEPQTETAEVLRLLIILLHPSRRTRRTRRLLIICSTPAPSAHRRPSCAPRLGWQPQQLAPLGCKVHGGAALVTTAPTLREHRRARMHDVQHTPALRPLCAVSSACNVAARGPRARHARRRGDHAPRAFTQAHDGGCSGGTRVQAPRCELLRTALGRRRGKGT